MVNRRIARSSRNKQKKKAKISKKAKFSENPARHGDRAWSLDTLAHGGADGSAGKVRLITPGRKLASLKKSRSAVCTTALAAHKKKKSAILKKQAAERMVLKKHLQELEARRAATRRGENAKTERCELGKYIRQLKEEQRVKHTSELQNIEAELTRLVELRKQKSKGRGNEEDHNEKASHSRDWEDLDGEEESTGSMDEKELLNMFAHLTA